MCFIMFCVPVVSRSSDIACLGLLPDLWEEFHEGIVDHERDGHVQADATHARNGALVEAANQYVQENIKFSETPLN